MTDVRNVRVLIVDDHAVVREGIRHVLSSGNFEIVGEAASGGEALKLMRTREADVVLLDISLPDTIGLDLVPQLKALGPHTRILILSIHDHEEYVLQSVRAGAHGYLRKDTSPAELRGAITSVFQGDSFFSPAVARQLTAALQNERATEERHEKYALLTPRERAVLAEIARGATSKEIAQRFGISPRTVESHREAISRKLDVHGVAALTRLAVDVGLVPASGAELRINTER
ncbi:MAG TPA: response regulator transcription factor [Gemmatimonadaceae bacterium]|nr:response regulator transcription factor [Gemmatimonadaceae bacterium]